MNKEYWDSRCLKHGHTGWSDHALYFYDQPVRVRFITNFCSSLGLDRNCPVLDFGCGTGDIVNALSERFPIAFATDISEAAIKAAATRHKNSSVSFFTLEQMRDHHFGIILAITVLQHIIDDRELAETLKRLTDRLADGGIWSPWIVWTRHRSIRIWISKNWRLSGPLPTLRSGSAAGRAVLFPLTGDPTPNFTSYRNSFVTRVLLGLRRRNVPLAENCLKLWAEHCSSADAGIGDQHVTIAAVVLQKARVVRAAHAGRRR